MLNVVVLSFLIDAQLLELHAAHLLREVVYLLLVVRVQSHFRLNLRDQVVLRVQVLNHLQKVLLILLLMLFNYIFQVGRLLQNLLLLSHHVLLFLKGRFVLIYFLL